MANVAFIGLGNMGGPMAANLVKAGHKVTAFDLVAASRDQAKSDGAAIAESGVGAAKQVHILVKPTRAELMTNLVINTDRRTYHMELRATPSTYMASVSWQYPQDQLIALRRQNSQAEAAQPVSGGIDLARVNFRYEVTGDRAPWRPLRAFDDGKQVFIEFPRGIGQGEMPPLFVVGPEGDTSELVNYRVRGNYMIVDRLFGAAELRLGGDGGDVVRIERTDGVARRN